MYDGRTRLSREVAGQVRQHFPLRVFATAIPRSVRISEAPIYGLPVTAYAPESPGARAYQELAREVLEACGVRGEPEPAGIEGTDSAHDEPGMEASEDGTEKGLGVIDTDGAVASEGGGGKAGGGGADPAEPLPASPGLG